MNKKYSTARSLPGNNATTLASATTTHESTMTFPLESLSTERPNLALSDEIAKCEKTLLGVRMTCWGDPQPNRVSTDESQDDAVIPPMVGGSSTILSHRNLPACTTSTKMSPVHSLVQGVVHAVENVQEQRRKAQCRKRITQALLTLRAAATVLEDQKRQKRCDDDDDEEEDSLEECEWRTALLNPLSDLQQKPHHLHAPPRLSLTATSSDDDNTRQGLDSGSNSVSSDSLTTMDEPSSEQQPPSQPHEKFPVQILPEPEASLRGNPRLLTQTMFQQLMEEGIPHCLHMNAWERVFSIGRDGDSFLTLLERCAPYRYSILVVQTTTGHILGGFVSDTWQVQQGFTRKHSYYGTGVSFLFANHPNDGTNDLARTDDKPLSIYPWTGSNDFCQICNMDRSVLAMGGSGAFGFILEDNFTRGSTDSCGTFGNPPLTTDKDGIFTVADMEIYGLVPFGFLQLSHDATTTTTTTTTTPMSESPRSVVQTDAGGGGGGCS